MNIITKKKMIDVADVMKVFSYAEWTKNRTLEDVKRIIHHSDLVVLLKEDDAPIGFARVLTDFVCRAFIEDVIVLPEYQFCGMGKFIIETVESYLKGYGVSRIELSTSKTQFWEKCGYVQKYTTTHMIKQLKENDNV